MRDARTPAINWWTPPVQKLVGRWPKSTVDLTKSILFATGPFKREPNLSPAKAVAAFVFALRAAVMPSVQYLQTQVYHSYSPLHSKQRVSYTFLGGAGQTCH